MTNDHVQPMGEPCSTPSLSIRSPRSLGSHSPPHLHPPSLGGSVQETVVKEGKQGEVSGGEPQKAKGEGRSTKKNCR